MCLLTATEVPSLVEEDLQVFKMFRLGTLTTVHRDFTYTLDQLFQTEMLLSKQGISSDQIAVEAFLRMGLEFHCDWGRRLCYLPKDCTHSFVGQGFHSCDTEDRAARCKLVTNICPQDEIEIRTAIIPAGSLVYRDNTGLIVSNQIIIK